MSLKAKAVRGFFWQIISISSHAIINFAFLFIIARLLDPHVFGIYAIVGGIIALLVMITEFGFGAALIQLEIITEKHINTAFWLSMALGIFFLLLLVLLSKPIVEFYDYKFDRNVILLLALNLIIYPVGVISKSLLIRKLEFKLLFKANIISYVLGNLIITLSLAYLGYGIYSLVIGFIVTSFMMSLLLLIYNPIKISFAKPGSELRDILSFGTGLTIVRIIYSITSQLDKLILGKLVPYTTLGYFERAQTVQNLPNVYLWRSIDGILFSLLSKLQNNIDRLRSFFFPFLNLISIFTIYCSITVFYFSETIISIILGKEWLEATAFLQILSSLIFIGSYSAFIDTLTRSLNKFFIPGIIKSVYLVSTIICIISGYNLGLVEGAIVGWVIANIIQCILLITYALYLTKTKISSFLVNIIPLVLFGVLLLLKIYLINNVAFSHSVMAKLGLYLFGDILFLMIYLKFPTLLGKENILVIKELTKVPKLKNILSKLNII